MKYLKVIFLIITLSWVFCCQSEKEDPKVLEEIVSGYFEALANSDFDKMDALTTSDFIISENGELWNNDTLKKILTNAPIEERLWTLTNFETRVEKTSGTTSYDNHGKFKINDSLTHEIEWIETATFKKVDGQWKMSYLQSSIKKEH